MILVPDKIELPPNIDPEGNPTQFHLLGMTFNGATIWCTLVAGAIVVGLGLWLRSQLTKKAGTDAEHVPTKLQILWEGLVSQVTVQVEDSLGKVNPFVVPLAVALFFFILIANWLEMIPTKLNEHDWQLFISPTADTNLTYALAVLVIVGVWTFGIRQKGLKGYFSHLVQPFPILLPLNLLEELIRPVTLALRLFGNIFAGGIMLGLIAGLVSWKLGGFPVGGIVSVVANVIWKLFDMVIGVIQAFIFALLTVLYFGMAGATHADHEDHQDHDENHELAA